MGAVVVQDRRIVATGYNGAPPGMPHCTDVGCDVPPAGYKLTGPKYQEFEPLPEEGCQRAIHAETNALLWAARKGVHTEDGIMYCTHGPCLKCAQAIIAAGIREVYYITPYRLFDGLSLLTQARVIHQECHVVEE